MFGILVNASLRNRLLVLAAAVILVLYGAVSVKELPVDVLPDLNRPTVTLLVEAGGMAPEEVEQLVTFPIESAMTGMQGVSRVRSVSGIGLSVVYVEFDWGTEIFTNRQQVVERLNRVRHLLPPGVEPQLGPISSIMGEILLIAMSSETQTPMAVRDLADWVVRPRLMAIPGISQVIAIGGEVRQFRVTPDLLAMQRLDITVEGLKSALERFGSNSGGGFVDQSDREYLIRNIGRTLRVEDLRSIVVGYADDQPILLQQIAEVEIGVQVRRGDGGYMGKPAVIVSVQKQPGADTIALTAAVNAALADIGGHLPHGVAIDNVLFSQATFIEASINNVRSVLFEAIVVVTIVLFLFLLNVRTTLISLTAIPVSILVTVLVFRYFGLSINTMTLGGIAIAIGELVDDAVVDVENVFRRLRENALLASPKPALAVVAEASQEVRTGIVYATAIVILVFVPLFALPGLEGRLFTPLGVAYIVSILASLVVSITLTPVMCSYLLPKLAARTGAHEGALIRHLKAVNGRLVLWALDHRRALFVSAAAAVALSAAVATTFPRAFLPPFNEGSLTVNVVTDPGISLAESSRIGTIAEMLLMRIPEVVRIGRRTGRAELDEHAEGVHSSDLEAILRPSERSLDEIMNDVRTKLSMLPVSMHAGQPIEHRIGHMMSGVRADFALKIFGDDLDTLRSIAGDVYQRLKSVDGVTDLAVEKQVNIPQLQNRVDYDRARLYGATPAAVVTALENLSNGHVVSQIADGVRRISVVLRLGDENRTARTLGNLLVETPSGRVPLSFFASVDETYGPNQILRENGRRRIVVIANSDGTDVSQIVRQIRDEVIPRVKLPPGYFVRLEGTFQAQEQAMERIAGLSVISLALVFLVLYSRYQSSVLALIVMVNIPLALIGSVIALWIAGEPLSIASMIGFITLAGISTRNGILKVSHYINLARREGEAFGRALILRGSQERLTPVLMTALSAGLALLPLLVDAGQPGKEILHPVAVVIFGGLFGVTLLDALMTPALFYTFGEAPLRRLAEAQNGSAPNLAEAM